VFLLKQTIKVKISTLLKLYKKGQNCNKKSKLKKFNKNKISLKMNKFLQEVKKTN